MITKYKKSFQLFLIAGLLFLLSPGRALAQAGSLIGTAVDTTGAALASGHVHYENQKTHTAGNAEIDKGSFHIENLAEGNYTLTVSSPGFADDVLANLAIAADQARSVQAVLKPTAIVEEVTVTATRRETLAQDTPIAVTTYSAETLQSQAVHNLGDLQRIDPSLNITQSAGSDYVAIRGIASMDIEEIGDPSVPIARDGFFTNRPFGILTSIYDIDHIEVLKGPQGTLFGRNSTGGLVNIVSARPDKQTSYRLSATGGDYAARHFEGAWNKPLGNKLQLRLSGISYQHDGYRKLTYINKRGDDEDVQSGRLQLAFQPLAHLHGLVSAQIDHNGGFGDVHLMTAIGTRPTNFDAKNFDNYQPSSLDQNQYRFRWEASYDALPFGLTLSYAGGFDRTHFHHIFDATPLTLSPLRQFDSRHNPDTWNHEVRLVSPDDKPLTYQVGFFDFSEHNKRVAGLKVQSGSYANRYLAFFDQDVHSSSRAVYGQTAYALNPHLKLSLGGRYTWDHKEESGESIIDLAVATNGMVPAKITTPSDGSDTQGKAIYHAGIDWTLSNGNLLYAKYDTGYKSGGFNTNGTLASVSYGPETSQAYEVGSKNRLFNNHLQLNIDGFHQPYSGYQAEVTLGVLSGGSGIENAGKATIDGGELELTASSEKLGHLRWNSTGLRTRFKAFEVVDGDGTSQQVRGNELPNAPEFVTILGYDRAIRIGKGVLTPRFDVKYSAGFNFTLFNFSDTEQTRATTEDLAITYSRNRANWYLEGYAHNLSDAVIFSGAARNYDGPSNNYQFAPPRTIGIQLVWIH